jgi:antitoxin MazE
MRAQIIKIGNSQGIRIPKTVLEQTGLKDEVELEVEDNKIIIRSIKQPRQGWEESFKKMAENKDDKLLDKDLSLQNNWDKDEWQWE